MYFQQSEHNLPHIHAVYGEYIGVINIQTREMFEGDLPTKALKLVHSSDSAARINLKGAKLCLTG
ncbi:MAG TPA: hypothetical protein DCG57_21140 [Candidatus Riflebacteria bacterium]|jgi:hypothetical protein|nr:hypothetical protein [Candidatus Riflebacteria bacterium]